MFFYCTDYIEIFRGSGLWAAFSQCRKQVAKLNTTISFYSSILSNVLDTMPVAKTNKKTKLNVCDHSWSIDSVAAQLHNWAQYSSFDHLL